MRRVLVLACVIFISGCVRSHVRMLDERTAVITARGTAFDNMSDVTHGAFVQSAQIAKRRGYKYFMITDDNKRINTSYMYTPGQNYTNGSVQVYGNTAYYQQNTVSTPGSVSQFNKPVEDTMVMFFKEGEVNPKQPGIWDADSVLLANPSK